MQFNPVNFHRMSHQKGEQIVKDQYQTYDKMSCSEKMAALQDIVHKALEGKLNSKDSTDEVDCFARIANRVYKENEPGFIAKLFYKMFGQRAFLFDKFKILNNYNKLTHELVEKCPERGVIFAAKNDDIELLKVSLQKLNREVDIGLKEELVQQAAIKGSSKTIEHLLKEELVSDNDFNDPINNFFKGEVEDAQQEKLNRAVIFLSQYANEEMISKLGYIGVTKLRKENNSLLAKLIGNMNELYINQEEGQENKLLRTLPDALQLLEKVDRSAHKEVLEYMIALTSELRDVNDENIENLDVLMVLIKKQKTTESIKSVIQLSTKVVKENEELNNFSAGFFSTLLQKLSTEKSEEKISSFSELAEKLIEVNPSGSIHASELGWLLHSYNTRTSSGETIKSHMSMACALIDRIEEIKENQKIMMNELAEKCGKDDKRAKLYSDIAIAIIRANKDLTEDCKLLLRKLISQIEVASDQEAKEIEGVAINLVKKNNSEFSVEYSELLNNLCEGPWDTTKCSLINKIFDYKKLSLVNIGFLSEVIKLKNEVEEEKSFFNKSVSNLKIKLINNVAEHLIQYPVVKEVEKEDIDSSDLIVKLKAVKASKSKKEIEINKKDILEESLSSLTLATITTGSNQVLM